MTMRRKAWSHKLRCGMVMALLGVAWLACTSLWAAGSPNPPKKIYVESFPGKLDAAQLHDEVVARLRASHEVAVVDNAAQADLIVRGEGAIWLKGYVSINPHPTGVREPVYGGYLSLEVEKRSGEMIWSYLVMPSRMHWSGVAPDMAEHIVRLMLVALERPQPWVGRSSASLPNEMLNKVTLAGAGSTFAAPLYQEWIESFADSHPEVHTTYQAVGSEEGVSLFEDGKVDFAASDAALTNEQLTASRVKAEQYATVLGGVVPAYNLPGVTRDLQFTPQILARIYLGKITRWNDPQLRAVNRGVSLPDMPIVVLHRSDGSGTTFAWTQFLAETSAEWKSAIGSGLRVNWPAGKGLDGNDGVALGVAETPGAIGYVELTYAVRHELSYGLVRNAAGRFVQANLETLSAAASEAPRGGGSHTSLVNAPGKDAYPVATFTWLVLAVPGPAPGASTEKTVALRDLLRWMLTAGQRECSALGYVPLPKNLAERELAQIPPATAQLASGPLAK